MEWVIYIVGVIVTYVMTWLMIREKGKRKVGVVVFSTVMSLMSFFGLFLLIFSYCFFHFMNWFFDLMNKEF